MKLLEAFSCVLIPFFLLPFYWKLSKWQILNSLRRSISYNLLRTVLQCYPFSLSLALLCITIFRGPSIMARALSLLTYPSMWSSDFLSMNQWRDFNCKTVLNTTRRCVISKPCISIFKVKVTVKGQNFIQMDCSCPLHNFWLTLNIINKNIRT